MAAMTFLGHKYSNLLIAAASAGAVFVGDIASAQATTYYVSALTGNDHNTGKSTTTAFKTIGHITNGNLASGDIVVVMPGTYDETVKLTVAGKASAYTTLMAQAGAARPVIIGAPTQAGSDASYAAINVWAAYTRVVGFDVSWHGADGDAIGVWGPTAKDSKGVVRPAVHHIDIENNIAHDSGCGGIDSINADYVTVINNVTYNNGHTAPQQCSGISLGQLTDYDSGTGFHNIIASNLSYSNLDITPVPGTKNTTDGNGIIIDDSRHTETDNAAYHGSTLIYGNIVFNNGGCGILAFSSDNVTITNNTAYFNQRSTTIQGVIAELSSERSGTITFKNNIGYSGNAKLPSFQDNTSTGDSWDYNLTDIGGNYVASATKLTLGTHNLGGVSPQFLVPSTSAATANFQLATTSPALHAGYAVSYGVADFSGTVLKAGTKPNLGAYAAN